MANKAIIAGSSGLIGSNLLNILLEQPFYDEVLILVRKKISLQHKKLTQLVVDFDRLDNYADQLTGHAFFCCLGTTKAKTPDPAIYKKIDHDYPVKLAQLAHKNDVKQCHLVSAMGADAKSSMFYLKTKGETEDDIIKTGIPNTQFYRPALITGDRKDKGLGEQIANVVMKVIDPLLFGSWKNYRSIPAQTIAMAMYKQSINDDKGVMIHLSDTIKQLS